jgi:hypothetical protein
VINVSSAPPPAGSSVLSDQERAIRHVLAGALQEYLEGRRDDPLDPDFWPETLNLPTVDKMREFLVQLPDPRLPGNEQALRATVRAILFLRSDATYPWPDVDWSARSPRWSHSILFAAAVGMGVVLALRWLLGPISWLLGVIAFLLAIGWALRGEQAARRAQDDIADFGDVRHWPFASWDRLQEAADKAGLSLETVTTADPATVTGQTQSTPSSGK